MNNAGSDHESIRVHIRSSDSVRQKTIPVGSKIQYILVFQGRQDDVWSGLDLVTFFVAIVVLYDYSDPARLLDPNHLPMIRRDSRIRRSQAYS